MMKALVQRTTLFTLASVLQNALARVSLARRENDGTQAAIDDPKRWMSIEERFAAWHALHSPSLHGVAGSIEAFARSAAHVDRRNQERAQGKHTMVLTLNRFAALTDAEFSAQGWAGHTKVGEGGSHAMNAALRSAPSVPPAVDWVAAGKVTPVRNQESCGSCWAFSATGAVEGAAAIATGSLVELSPQELVSCGPAPEMKACYGGDSGAALRWIASNGGQDTEHDYPYTAMPDRCDFRKEHSAKNVTITGGLAVPPAKPAAMLAAAATAPISVAIAAGGLDFRYYKGGIFNGTCGSSLTDLDHGVLLVGYSLDHHAAGATSGVLRIKNSWGTAWGEDGFIRFPYSASDANGTCGINLFGWVAEGARLAPPSPPLPPSPHCSSDWNCDYNTTCCCSHKIFGSCAGTWSCCSSGEMCDRASASPSLWLGSKYACRNATAV
jgi:hypothetical protein